MYDKKKLAANFDKASGSYDDVAVLQTIVLERLLERFEYIKLNPEPKTILDLGSGTGNGAQKLAKLFSKANVIQLDLSRRMLLTAKSKKHRFAKKDSFICSDIQSVPLKTTAVDLIFSSLTLQWSDDLNQVFTECQKVLADNGLLLFSILGLGSLQELKDSWAAIDTEKHVNDFFDIQSIGDALMQSGLVDPVLDAEEIILTYDHCLDLLRDLKKTGVSNVHLERHKGLTGRNKIKKLSLQYEQYRNEGKLPATYNVIYGHAWKLEQPNITEQYIPIHSIKTK